jgi:hypothetical protein
MGGMGGAQAWAWSMSLLTWCAHLPRPTLYVRGASAAGMLQRLGQQTPSSHEWHSNGTRMAHEWHMPM